MLDAAIRHSSVKLACIAGARYLGRILNVLMVVCVVLLCWLFLFGTWTVSSSCFLISSCRPLVSVSCVYLLSAARRLLFTVSCLCSLSAALRPILLCRACACCQLLAALSLLCRVCACCLMYVCCLRHFSCVVLFVVLASLCPCRGGAGARYFYH